MEIRIIPFKKLLFYTILFIFIVNIQVACSENNQICMARLKYDGGGDWYNDPEVLPNLLKAYAKKFNINNISFEEKVATLKNSEIYKYPIIYITGHGNINFSEREGEILKNYLISGGFLYADDDYGMDKSFRREIEKIFPNKRFIELPENFKIYKFPYKMSLPKIHEHYKGPPKGLGLFYNGRLIIYYTYNTNISDGWADFRTHHDKLEVREKALKMGINILYYGLSN